MKSFYLRVVTLTILSIVCLEVFGFGKLSGLFLYGLIVGSLMYGAYYFFVESEFMENARMGAVLRKHKKDAHETGGGHLVISDRQITD